MEKDQKIFLILLAAIIVSAAFFLAAPHSNAINTPTTLPSTIQTSKTVTAFYFYGDGCSHCEKVKPILATLETRYPELHITRLEINNNVKNRHFFLEMSNKY
ncbi:MAG: thioredoxin family protein, partial [Methanoregula sp.]|nr:thioredoxin family protein [Methanoregula sp.]